MEIMLKELDPPDRAITAEELRRNCGYRTKEEAALDPYIEPNGIDWPEYTLQDLASNLEKFINRSRYGSHV